MTALTIGGIPVLVHASCLIRAFLKDSFHRFVTTAVASNSSANWHIKAKLGKNFPKYNILNPYAVDIYNANGYINVSRDDFFAALNPTEKVCNVSLKTPDVLDIFLRVFYSLTGLAKNMVLVHAAGLKYKGMAHLFVAPPMGGKTTIVKNAQVNEVFSDELVFLSKPNGYWKAYSTPFGGSFPAKESFTAQLNAIWFLQKSKICAASKMSQVDCARQLLKNVLFFSRNVRDHNKVLELISDLVTNVQAKRLKFARNTEVTKCIDMLKR